MRVYFLFFFFFLAQLNGGWCQKLYLDSLACERWTAVNNDAILSDDGKYVVYSIKNQPFKCNTLVLQSTDAKWKKEFINAGLLSKTISSQSNKVVLKTGTDSLIVVALGTGSILYLGSVLSCKIPDDNTDWFFYQLKGQPHNLIARNLLSDSLLLFKGVKTFAFNSRATVLLLVKDGYEESSESEIVWMDFLLGHERVIWRGKNAGEFSFDKSGSAVCFDSLVNKKVFAIWYFKKGMDKAIMVGEGNKMNVDGMCVNRLIGFSNDGKQILYNLIDSVFVGVGWRNAKNLVKVDVWSYKDKLLQSQQLQHLVRGGGAQWNEAIKSIDVNTGFIDEIRMRNTVAINAEENDNVWLVYGRSWNELEDNWQEDPSLPKPYVLLLNKHVRKELVNDSIKYDKAKFSPSGENLIYYDDCIRAWFSYNVNSEKLRNITDGIKTDWCDSLIYDCKEMVLPRGVAGWVSGTEFVLLYDVFGDIWKVNLNNEEVAVNITNGYGRRRNVCFDIVYFNDKKNNIYEDSDLILASFDNSTKCNGYYSISLKKIKDPVLLHQGAYFSYSASAKYDRLEVSDLFMPIKSLDNRVFVLQRMSAKSSPNYYSTLDFKKYIQLSKVNCESEYNWLSSELLSWRAYNGRIGNAILYKPENFDSTKKYPVIFTYYEEAAGQLNMYLPPGMFSGGLNIPWIVSHEYLVCKVDLQFRIGHPGESAYDYIESVAQYLSTKEYVDSNAMGLQGHSFGGYITNYMVSHSTKFKAAVSSAGMSDLLSAYGGLYGYGGSLGGYYEIYQGRMGTTIWNDFELYVKNSAVFSADKVVTPILLLHNINDRSNPFLQGVEFFTALRRLQKPVWMLQYDNGIHGLFGKENTMDFTRRVMQFFNYYLKKQDPPLWMTCGVPAVDRNKVDYFMSPDKSGKKP